MSRWSPLAACAVVVGGVQASGWEMDDADEMHQKLREEASQIGANAVVLLHSGIGEDGALWSRRSLRWNGRRRRA